MSHLYEIQRIDKGQKLNTTMRKQKNPEYGTARRQVVHIFQKSLNKQTNKTGVEVEF